MTNPHRNHLRSLAALDALLTERSVTRAAARLHLSQPATSGALARLRALFNDPLLVRNGREMVLTARASELLPMAREALAKVDLLFGSNGTFLPSDVFRLFRVAVSDSVGQLLMPAVVERLARQAPGVTLRVSAAGSDVPGKLLGSGALDMAVAHYESIPADLRTLTLYEHKLVAVVRRAHPAIRRKLTLQQFVTTPQVAVFPHSASLEDELRRVFGAARRPFVLAASVQHLSTAAAIVARTDALALMTEPIALLYSRVFDIKRVPLPAELALPAVPVRAIWHERTQHDPASAWLRQVLGECVDGRFGAGG